jgi:uncharacterized protein
MSWAVAKKSVDFLFNNAKRTKENKMVRIDFWGGEPLLEWNLLKKITLYAESVSKRTTIPVHFGGTTNGTLLTEEKFTFLGKHGIKFLVSLDGTAESHNKYRVFRSGRGSHALIVKNMKKVLKKWPDYAVRLSPYPESIKRFYNDIKFLIDLGFRNVMYSPVFEANWKEKDWNKWEDEGYKVVDLLSEKKREGINIFIHQFDEFCGQELDQKYPCGAGRHYIGIDIDGGIYPCHRFCKFDGKSWKEKETCIGHVDLGIINLEFIDRFINFKTCEGCEFANTTPCCGGCPATNYDLTGDINTPTDKNCRWIKVQTKISRYMMEKENLKRTTPQAVMDLLRRLEMRVEQIEKYIEDKNNLSTVT